MFFCIKCKQQFGSHMSRFGDCPYCGTVNMVAQKRKELESNTLKANSDLLLVLSNYIKGKNKMAIKASKEDTEV